MSTTTRLTRVPVASLPERMQASWQRSQERRSDAVFIEALGNAPELFDWYSEFYLRVFYGGRVSTRHKEMLRYRLSSAHGCRHCNLGNRLDALDAGLTDKELQAIAAGDYSSFAAAERCLLTLAERLALTSPDGYVDAELHAELAAHYSDAEILELGMTAAVLTGMAKFLFAFDLVEREATCPIGRGSEV
ncbi:MAG: carboxymuconolactone decarboxylase family protein [Pseudomonadota bacterium]